MPRLTLAPSLNGVVQQRGTALAQIYHHHTHDQGQVRCLDTALIRAARLPDLLLFQREVGIGILYR